MYPVQARLLRGVFLGMEKGRGVNKVLRGKEESPFSLGILN